MDKIWREFWQGNDEKALLKLMNSYMSVVPKVARIVFSQNSVVELDDLIGAGVFGLADAIRGYSSGNDKEFEEYCWPVVKQAIMQELTWGSPALVRAWAKLNRQEKLIVVLHYYENCSFSDISNLLDMPLEVVKNRYQSLVSSLPLP